MRERERIIWGRWAVIIPAVGAVITGAALWYGNLNGKDPEVTNTVEVNQTASENGVNVGGDNNGTVNTGDFNRDVQ